MAKRPLPSPRRLRQLLKYDAATGALTWRPRCPKDFKSEKRDAKWIARIWNSNFACRPAAAPCSHGYLSATLEGRRLYAHRLAWAISYGAWPQGQIDHINGDRGDGRLCNLNDVSQSQNDKNSARQKNNTSGVIGVSFDKSRKRWFAYAYDAKSRRVFLGRFRNFDDAVEARKKAEKQCGYAKNHGSSRQRYG